MLGKRHIAGHFFCSILLCSCSYFGKREAVNFPEGGYAYPSVVTSKDSAFFWYPVKDLISKQDSILLVYSGRNLYESFNEPNLSLRPGKEITFRLISGGPPSIVIIVTESELIIKEGKTGSIFPYTNEEKLTEGESTDLNLLRYNYPLKKKNTEHSAWKNKWLDSLVAAKPELLTASYYLSLLEKSKTFPEEKFTYQTRRISIPVETFKKIADTLAASGYWSQSYQVPCNSHPTDGSSYVLEANTPKKYNIVMIDDCEINNSPIANAFQYLIKVAGLQQKIHIMGVQN
ncbi:MAG: hypothetical protein ABUT20_37425 [Bacteroidota bacterium]